MKKMMSILSLAILGLSGCANLQTHEHARGSVVAMDTPTEAHVCMNSTEVKQGEQLSLFKTVCVTKKTGGKFPTEQTNCDKVSKGFAEVTENSKPHFIKVKAMNDAVIEEGYIVEKQIK